MRNPAIPPSCGGCRKSTGTVPMILLLEAKRVNWVIANRSNADNIKPIRSPAERARIGEEEGRGGYAVFAALTETAETEWSRVLLTQ